MTARVRVRGRIRASSDHLEVGAHACGILGEHLWPCRVRRHLARVRVRVRVRVRARARVRVGVGVRAWVGVGAGVRVRVRPSETAERPMYLNATRPLSSSRSWV